MNFLPDIPPYKSSTTSSHKNASSSSSKPSGPAPSGPTGDSSTKPQPCPCPCPCPIPRPVPKASSSSASFASSSTDYFSQDLDAVQSLKDLIDWTSLRDKILSRFPHPISGRGIAFNDRYLLEQSRKVQWKRMQGVSYISTFELCDNQSLH